MAGVSGPLDLLHQRVVVAAEVRNQGFDVAVRNADALQDSGAQLDDPFGRLGNGVADPAGQQGPLDLAGPASLRRHSG